VELDGTIEYLYLATDLGVVDRRLDVFDVARRQEFGELVPSEFGSVVGHDAVRIAVAGKLLGEPADEHWRVVVRAQQQLGEARET